MSKYPSINDEDGRLEQIVAYLDGELPPVESSLVERQLAEDPDYRKELVSMERIWSALDALPTIKVDDRFSQTTMELVVGAAREAAHQKTLTLPIQQRKSRLGKMLAAIAAAALGFLLVQLMRENPNRTLLADLPVIQYIDTYSQFQEADFIRRLHEQLADEPWPADLTDEELRAEVREFANVVRTDNRREWLDQLEPEDRAALRARYNRFVSLPLEERDRLRALHAEVVTSADREGLERTLLRYRAWINSLPASRRFELREMPTIDRVREVLMHAESEAKNPWIVLSEDELRRLDRALAPIREQVLREMQPRGDRDGRFGYLQVIRRQLMDNHDEWMPRFADALPEEKRAKFESLTHRQQQHQMGRWLVEIRNALGAPRRGRGRFEEVSQQELERIFVEETDAAMKERLLAVPRDQMEQQLKRMYWRDEFDLDELRTPERPLGPPPRGGRDSRQRRGPPGRNWDGPPRGERHLPPPPPQER